MSTCRSLNHGEDVLKKKEGDLHAAKERGDAGDKTVETLLQPSSQTRLISSGGRKE